MSVSSEPNCVVRYWARLHSRSSFSAEMRDKLREAPCFCSGAAPSIVIMVRLELPTHHAPHEPSRRPMTAQSVTSLLDGSPSTPRAASFIDKWDARLGPPIDILKEPNGSRAYEGAAKGARGEEGHEHQRDVA